MSTSQLQKRTAQRLFKKYGRYGIVENSRPVWLVSSKGERLELDFYIEKLGVSVEVQGNQHFAFTPVFHNTIFDFEEQQRRDAEKLIICQNAGIELIYICSLSEIDQVVYVIDSFIQERLTPEQGSHLEVERQTLKYNRAFRDSLYDLELAMRSNKRRAKKVTYVLDVVMYRMKKYNIQLAQEDVNIVESAYAIAKDRIIGILRGEIQSKSTFLFFGSE